MTNAVDQIKATGQIYNILAPEIVGDYVERITEPCLNTYGYAKNDIFLCKDNQNVQRLCQADSAISNGQTLLEGTNCHFTTLSDLFAAAGTDSQPKTLATPLVVREETETTVEGALGAINNAVSDIDGDIEDLVTAIGGVDGRVTDLEEDIGDTDISTIGDGSVTGAISTLKEALTDGTLYFSAVACSASTGNFATVSNAKITADHVVAECTFSKPSAITSDVTWTTADGSLTLNGTCTDATCTANITLVRKGN